MKEQHWRNACEGRHSSSMKRICFVLQVKPNRLEEYKERHRTVWPEMQAALEEAGWKNYSLFLRPDGLLVGYLETNDFERARAAMAEREINRKWQQEMSVFFVQPDGLPPDRAMEPLEEIFHLQSTHRQGWPNGSVSRKRSAS